tara:strand:- start:6275 stop:8386 length:2112 start_codon:yes stop_codon:yes gene_type:complete
MIILSLTTTPPDMFELGILLDDLSREQTLKPDKIVVNIPSEYNNKMFRSSSIGLLPQAKNDDIIINICTDSGPATKILGLLEAVSSSLIEISPEDIVIFMNDNNYPTSLCAEYVKNFELIRDPHNTALGVLGDNLRDEVNQSSHFGRTNVVRGCGSYAITGMNIDKLREVFAIHHFPEDLFYEDDVFVSNILNRHFSVRVININSPTHQLPCVKTKERVSTSEGIGFLLEKNMSNFDLSEEQQKEILVDRFIRKNLPEIESKNSHKAKIVKEFSDIPLPQCIQELQHLEKQLKVVASVYHRLGLKIDIDTKQEKALFYEKFGVSKLIEEALDSKPFRERVTRTKKAAVVFHLPMNGLHGCQARCLEAIRHLVDMGFEVHLLSRNDLGPLVWDESSSQKIKDLGVKVLDVFPSEEGDYRPAWSNHIQKKIKQENYDFIYVNYEHVLTPEAYEAVSKYRCVIDTHDDINFSETLKEKVESGAFDGLDDSRLYYSDKRSKESPENFGIPKIFICEQEYNLLGNEQDVYIPHLVEPSIETKSFRGNPCFIGSDNPFNVDALNFMNGWLDFGIDIIGSVGNEKYINSKINPHLNFLGYVENISDVYSSCPFTVCPIIHGTGLKIKIQESLANATPVVSMLDSGIDSDITHGVNGFLCYDEKEMLKYCHLLLEDRDLCSSMGKNASLINQKRIQNTISFKEYIEILSNV